MIIHYFKQLFISLSLIFITIALINYMKSTATMSQTPRAKPQIHLIRHAESVHNVNSDSTILDPPLTPRGTREAASLISTFPRRAHVAIILTSPLRRTIETTLAAFGDIIDLANGANIVDSHNTKADCAKLIFCPDLAPPPGMGMKSNTSKKSRPCDTGSPVSILEKDFPELNFEGLEEDWYTTSSASFTSKQDTGRRMRERLASLIEELEVAEDGTKERRDIVLVTHGIVKEVVTGGSGKDWERGEWRSYTLERDADGEVRLVAVA
jgi:broad specificity phosphatase PhoE